MSMSTFGIEPSRAKVQLEETVIEPRRGWIPIDWRELYRHRELLYFLVWRDVKVRYKQTVLGVAWAVLQPVLSMVIFTIIFGNVAGMRNDLPPGMAAHYAVWLFAGLIPWLLFQTGMTDGGMSLVTHQSMLTKIYLPRLFVPAASVGRALVDMSIAFGVFAALMLYYQAAVAWTVLLVPLLVLLTVMTSLGIGLTLAALSVTYRDFRFIIPFMSQSWMWLSAVMFPIYALPERWQLIGAVNPMVGIVQGFRSAIFADMPWGSWAAEGAQQGGPFVLMLGISTVSATALFLFGLFYFRRTERRFADIA